MAIGSSSRLRRFLAFVISAVLAMWLALLIVGYASDGWVLHSYEPAPDRVGEIVRLVEATAPAEQENLLRALNTDSFHVALVAPGDRTDRPAGTQSDEALMRHYTAALTGHNFTATRLLAPPSARDPVHFRWQKRPRIALQIGLTSGGTLLIEATSPAILTAHGMPVGIGAGAIGTLIALIALWTLWREIAPLVQLARATEQIDLLGTPLRLPQTRWQSAEIRALARAIGRLHARLSALIQARMALLGGISHDLRSFTTRLRLRVEAIPDLDQRARAVADIEDMTRLLDDALLAARGNGATMPRELVDLAALVAEEVEGLAEQGLAATLCPGTPRQGLYVIGDPLSLRRIVLNLAGNAIRYGRATRIALIAERARLTLRFHDDGPGIDPEDRAEMQEPFTRRERSRNRDTGGAGLGLAVARSLIEAHEGSLSLEPDHNDGATVAVTLPRFTDL